MQKSVHNRIMYYFLCLNLHSWTSFFHPYPSTQPFQAWLLLQRWVHQVPPQRGHHILPAAGRSHDPLHADYSKSFFFCIISGTIPFTNSNKSDCYFSYLLLSQLVCGECLSVYLPRVKNQPSGTNYASCIYKAVGTYVFGAAASQSLTDIAKYTIGRLRPHFLAVCKPVWDDIDCKTGGYIENFTCTGEKFMVDEAR